MKVFLTGASAGIGLATAKILCEAGHEVWGSSRALGRLPVLKRFHPVELDLQSESSITAACAQVWQESKGIDVFINNAGQAAFGPLEQMEAEALRQQFEILFFGPFFLQQNLAVRMRGASGGVIINITSLAVELPIPFMGAYTAAKASLSAASIAFRLEATDDRIRWIDLRPGDISTDFNQAVTVTSGGKSASAGKAWKTIGKNMAAAPPAMIIAERILKIVEGNRTGPIVRVGDWFQSVLAPWGVRVLPTKILEKLIRGYYGIAGESRK